MSETRPRILVVDDHPDGAEALAVLLRMKGFDAEWAASGEAALERMREPCGKGLDALIVDEYMPGMSGMELVRVVRANGDWRDLPVVLLTAAADEPFARIQAELREGLQPAAAVRKPAARVEDVLVALEVLRAWGGPED